MSGVYIIHTSVNSLCEFFELVGNFLVVGDHLMILLVDTKLTHSLC